MGLGLGLGLGEAGLEKGLNGDGGRADVVGWPVGEEVGVSVLGLLVFGGLIGVMGVGGVSECRSVWRVGKKEEWMDGYDRFIEV